MNVQEFLGSIAGNLTVHRVFGDPHTTDGVTVIPVAKVMGGGGGGGGSVPSEHNGEGGGFGLLAWPAGAYVIKSGDVRWAPAVDYNRLIVLGAGLAFSTLRLAKSRRR